MPPPSEQRVQIRLLGRSFTLKVAATARARARVEEAARLVEDSLAELRAHTREVGAQELGLMAALALADRVVGLEEALALAEADHAETLRGASARARALVEALHDLSSPEGGDPNS